MKPDKHFITVSLVFVAVTCLIGLTWAVTVQAIHAQRLENTDRVTTTLTNDALILSEQVDRQILALDQTLRILVSAWEKNPAGFDLESWRNHAVLLSGLSRDMVLTDEHGTIRQSSVNEAVNQNASGLDYFRGLSDSSDAGGLYIGPSAIDGIMRQWHMNVARALRYPDGSFGGVIDTDYRIAAITDVFKQINLGAGSLVALVGLDDGKLRGAVGPATVDPDANIAETPMFVAIRDGEAGLWAGPSASDAVRRIHAFRQIPGRRLAIIVGMNVDEAMRPAAVWRLQAQLFAGCISILLIALAVVVLQGARVARRRETAQAEDHALLAASNAQLEVARAVAAAKVEQLEATLAGMSDGVALVDGHMCLVEWNSRFPEIAGVPADILRVGLPMEEILRAQIRSGQFGWVHDAEVEIERRMAHLRVGRFAVVQRQRPDGRTLELRRSRLPDGGFVTLYADITEHKIAEQSLHDARTVAEAAQAEKIRLANVVRDELRPSIAQLLTAIHQFDDAALTASQKSIMSSVSHCGEMVSRTVSDIVDMVQLEAGQITLHPTLLELRPLIHGCVGLLAGRAAERNSHIRLVIADDAPDTLFVDAGRLRQLHLNLLSNAIERGSPGEISLLVEPRHDAGECLKITIRTSGPVISDTDLASMFQGSVQPAAARGEVAACSALTIPISLRLVKLIGGDIGCERWISDDGVEGTGIWITLPSAVLPAPPPPIGVSVTDEQSSSDTARGGMLPTARVRVPRTRILLIEDVNANHMATAQLLRRGGHHVDIVASPPGVIGAMTTRPYDLILMDLLVPGMGGLEVTQLMRGLPEPARSTPIVALTANVSSDDEANCKALVFDGVLEKPVVLNELLEVVCMQVWVKTSDPNPVNDGGSSNKDLAGQSVLSEDRIGELRSNLPPEVFASLVEECLVDMDHRIPALRRALAAGAPAAINAHAHAMVGMAASYGMAALESRLRSIMGAAREGDLQRLGPDVAGELRADFDLAAERLRELLRLGIA